VDTISEWYDLLALKLLYRRRDLRDWYLLVSFLSVRVCVFVCMWHVSLRMFNLFMIPLRKIRARAFVTDINNQLAWKCIKKTCHALFGLDVAGRLVVNAFYVKLTEDQVRISLKRTFMYFPWFFILPLFLKVHKNSHSMVKWFFFKYRKNQIHHCICFLFDCTILDRFRTFRNIIFGENVILSPFREIWYF
jgi:hypothetical protein